MDFPRTLQGFPRTLRCLAATVVLTLCATPALAENRIALVIGNANYQTVTVLPNPANDAKAMTDLLTAAGFEIVEAPDQTQSDLRRTLREFAGKVAEKGPDTVALVYYAGHGLQVDGENFLVPVDARIEREADVPIETVRLADMMNALASTPSRTRIVILDACRNNPFATIRATTGRGLAIVDAPTGSIVSYATSPGMEALDGEDANSPFTGALVTIAKEPGLPIEQAFKRVRLAVHQATNGQQTPWESSSLTGDFSFFAGTAIVTLPPTGSDKPSPASIETGAARAEQTAKSIEQWRDELRVLQPQEAYELVVREDAVEGYAAFIAIYGNTPLTATMRALLDRRREMLAWYEAVSENTVAAYNAFLERYPNGDLAATARRLRDRTRTRGALAALTPTPVAAAPAGTCPCEEPQGATPAPTRVLAPATPAIEPPVTLPPLPPPRVSVPPPARVVSRPPPARVVEPPPKIKRPPPIQHVSRPPPTRHVAPPPRRVRPPTDADVFGPGRGHSAAPPISIGIGVGIPIGRRGGGGYVPRPGGHTPSHWGGHVR